MTGNPPSSCPAIAMGIPFCALTRRAIAVSVHAR